jgi:hypothetical protein
MPDSEGPGRRVVIELGRMTLAKVVEEAIEVSFDQVFDVSMTV